MKEITRRLYTKPVMLGMAFLVGMGLVVGLFVTTKSERGAERVFHRQGTTNSRPLPTAKPITTSRALRYPRASSGPVPNAFTGASDHSKACL